MSMKKLKKEKRRAAKTMRKAGVKKKFSLQLKGNTDSQEEESSSDEYD